ncbi:MAG: hypothetical protein D6793_08125 [Thermoflexia bacterium]|nr:MAG: hypothetical protein D6793_08125 [Thermoflexia bacterium]
MEDERQILIGGRIFRREDLFQAEKEARKERARLPLEEKIRILVSLQKLARDWGRKGDVIVWEI